MQKRILSFVAVSGISISLLLSSCKKDDAPAPATKTNTQLITQSSWKFDKATSAGLDVTAFIPACWKDNVATFSANQTGTVDEGANVCASAASTFTWEFQSGETALHLSASPIPTGNTDFKLESLTETNLVISQSVIIPPSSTSQNVVFTFKH